MIEPIERFLYDHYIIVYCAINIIYYLITHLYRMKYYDNIAGKYRKSVEQDKPANILLAAIKLLLMTSSIILMVIVTIIKIITFNKIFIPKYTLLNRGLVVVIYITTTIFLLFPLIITASLAGLFGNYTTEEIDYSTKK